MTDYRNLDATRLWLVLPSGEVASTLRLGALLAELRRLNISGISPTMTKLELLDAYERHVRTTADELRAHKPFPRGTNTPPGCRELSAFVVQQALVFIEREAARR